MSAMRMIGIVGARRRRQGIGEHVATQFARCGAAVAAIAGTTSETVEAARRALEAKGIRVRGYTSVDAMLAAERLDVLAVCSPIPAHGAAVEAGLRAGLHVLCEKPMLFDPDLSVAAEVSRLARAFAERGRHLATVTQWPQTLGAFARLHPAADIARVQRFWMRLSPISTGWGMVVDSISHPLSMLRALVGPGEVRDPAANWESDDRVTLTFAYEHARGSVATSVRLARTAEQPRPAGYAIDGREARREVSLPDYSMHFTDGTRRVPVEDPLGLLVREFLDRLDRGDPPDIAGLASDAAGLEAIVDASRRTSVGTGRERCP